MTDSDFTLCQGNADGRQLGYERFDNGIQVFVLSPTREPFEYSFGSIALPVVIVAVGVRVLTKLRCVSVLICLI